MTIINVFTCDTWHSNASMQHIGSFNADDSLPEDQTEAEHHPLIVALKRYLRPLRKKKIDCPHRLTDDDLTMLRKYGQTQGYEVNIQLTYTPLNSIS